METIFLKDNNSPKTYIAFFDLDKTLTGSISGRALAREAYRKGFMSAWNLINAVLLSITFRFKLKDPLKIIDDMVSWSKGIPEKTLIDLCNEVFHRVLLPSVYNEAKSEIEFHKSRNAKVVILSSALTPICREMAMILGMDDIICSELEVNNGYMTGRPVGHLCFGEEKAVRLKEYCLRNNSLQSDAFYYGDSISDFPALNVVGNPVCVNPDHKLKKTALERNWKTLYWKD